MDTRKEKMIKWFKRNQRLNVFGVCFMLSFSFWLLIKLSYNYNVRVIISVDYDNMPEGKLLVNQPIDEIQADISAPGFSIFGNWLRPFGSVTIDVASLPEINQKGVDWAYLATNQQKQILKQQLPNGIEVLQVYPDTLYYGLGNLASKKVAVRVDEAVKFRRQFVQRGKLDVEPDSVDVFGPAPIIDTIQFVSTEMWEALDVHEAMSSKLALVNPNESLNVFYSEKKVKAALQVDQVTEAEAKVDIKVLNVPEGYELKVFPRKVSVNYLVSLRDFKAIDSDMFVAEVHYPLDDVESTNVLSVKVRSLSPDLDIIQIKPEKVEFIIRKK